MFGVLNSTVWKPSRNITATAQAHSTQYVVIDPGVLDLVDTAVTVSADNGKTASSSGTEAGADAAEDSQNQQTSQDQQAQTEPQVCMAVGSAKDVSGWLAGEPYVRVTGLDTWQTLSTSEEQAKGTASTSQNQVAFADSDMWSQVECGSTSTTMHLNNAQPAQVMLIDFGTKAPSADLSMQWVRQRVPDFALPWYFGGGLCAVLAVLSASVFAMEPHTRRKKQAESAQAKPKAAKSADEPTIGAALEKYRAERPRGEFVLVIRGAPAEKEPRLPLEDALALVEEYRAGGMKLKDAARRAAAETGRSRNDLYHAALVREKESGAEE